MPSYPHIDANRHGLSIPPSAARPAFERKAVHWLGPFEARVLPRLARALPAWVLPDHLTALGLLAALGAAWCLSEAAQGAQLLWVANGLLVLNWLGDSLDGTLARVRKTERPRYGFYLDHLMDMMSVAAILCGLGQSPYMSFSVALIVISAYYLMAINTHLQLKTLGIYEIAYNGIGPTEGRLLLMSCIAALALGFAPVVSIGGVALEALDVPALLIATCMLAMAAASSFKNLRALARSEPSGRRRSAHLSPTKAQLK